MNSILASILIGLATQCQTVLSQCFADESMNTQWAQIINGDDTSTEFSIEGSCCQETVCALPCAQEVPPPAKVIIFVHVSIANDICKLMIPHHNILLSNTHNVNIIYTHIGIWYSRDGFNSHLRYHRLHDCVPD